MSTAKEERCTKCGRLVGLSRAYVDGAVYMVAEAEIKKLEDRIDDAYYDRRFD